MTRVLDNKIVSLGPYHQLLIDGPELKDSTEYGWKDMTADLAAGKAVGANAPDWAQIRDGIYAYAFDDSVMQEIWITFHPNHDIIEGELFHPHVHFTLNTTNTGVVRWGFEYTMAKGFDQEAFPASSTVYKNFEIATNSQYRHLIAEVDTGIPMPEVDSLILVRIFRDAADAADTLTGDVFGLTADIHYRSGKLFTKGKRPDFNLPD